MWACARSLGRHVRTSSYDAWLRSVSALAASERMGDGGVHAGSAAYTANMNKMNRCSICQVTSIQWCHTCVYTQVHHADSSNPVL